MRNITDILIVLYFIALIIIMVMIQKSVSSIQKNTEQISVIMNNLDISLDK